MMDFLLGCWLVTAIFSLVGMIGNFLQKFAYIGKTLIFLYKFIQSDTRGSTEKLVSDV